MAVALGNTKKLGQPNPDINITPLVDVCLVLLIIFMVIAPALNEGAMLELPKAVTADQKAKEANPIELAVGVDGAVVLEKQKIDPAALKAKIGEIHAQDPKRSLMIKMDHLAPYKKVRDMFALVADIGFRGILLKVSDKKDG
jgi:biopolymer transport protein ExbD/biopolymer transport protein TolR